MLRAVTAAIIALALALAGMVGVVVYLVRRGDAATDRAADARIARADAAAELAHARFELERAKEALSTVTARISRLEGLAYDADAAPRDDLDPGDLDGRLRRIESEWYGDTPAAGSAGGAPGAGAVPDAAAAGATAAPAVPGVGAVP